MADDLRRLATDGIERVATDGTGRVLVSEQVATSVGSTRDTLLVISGFGIQLYQARGLTQSLEAIGASHSQGRDIGGALLDLSAPQFRKYMSKITCTDSSSPPLDNVFPGLTVQVDCACELCYLTGNPGSPDRPAVAGSIRTAGDYTLYRPTLTMLVRDVRLQFDEWAADIQWQIDLEEV